MPTSMTAYAPFSSDFHKSDTNTLYFPDKANLALNFDLLNWEQGVPSANNCYARVDVDNRLTTGTLASAPDVLVVYVNNWMDFVPTAGQVSAWSTTSSGYASLVARNSVLYSTANGPLIVIPLGSWTDRYWEIQLQGGTSIAPDVVMMFFAKKYEINTRWNWGGNQIVDDMTVCELTQSRSFYARNVHRAPNMKINTRVWTDAPDADLATMTALFEATDGPFLPWVLFDYDMTAMNQYRVVRFDPSNHGNGAGFSSNQSAHQFNEFAITFRDVPRLIDGTVL